jgi:hypothetical protein
MQFVFSTKYTYNYGDQIHCDGLGSAYNTQGEIRNTVVKRIDDITIVVEGNEKPHGYCTAHPIFSNSEILSKICFTFHSSQP